MHDHQVVALPGAAVAPLCLSPPHKDKGRPVASGPASRENMKNENLNCAADPAAEQISAIDIKLLATLRTRSALAGWMLARGDAEVDTYTASQWGRATADMRGLAEVALFADRVRAQS